MLEVAFAGEEHGDVELVAFIDRVLVADRAAGLDDCFDAVLSRQGDAVVKREEGVGG